MALDMPTVRSAEGLTGALTLDDLRDLVAAATGMPGDLVVRVNASFRGGDLFNSKGLAVSTMTLDRPDDLGDQRR